MRPFTAGQIDERHLGDFFAAEAGLPVEPALRQDDGEDGVGAGRLGVHVGRRHRPLFVAFRHQIVDVVERTHRQLRQPVHIRAYVGGGVGWWLGGGKKRRKWRGGWGI